MRILGIDTSSERTSVAMVVDGAVVTRAEHTDPRRHVEVLTPLLAGVMDAPQLIAVGVGPGPYTGLRGGIVTALVLGEALGVRVVGICSLDAIAEQVIGPAAPFLVTADARRREVYWAAYDPYGVRIDGPCVGGADGAAQVAAERGWGLHAGLLPEAAAIARLAGSAVDRGEDLAAPVLELAPHGADGAATARAIAGRVLLHPAPLYLRRPDAAGAA